MIKIANKTVAVLKQSTLNRFDWLFYSHDFLFLDKQPEKHSTASCDIASCDITSCDTASCDTIFFTSLANGNSTNEARDI